MTSKVRRVILIRRQFRYSLIGILAATVVIALLVLYQYSSPALVVDKSTVSINKRGERVYQGIALTGEMVSYHDSGFLASADQFVNGRRQGYAKKWFKDGVLGYESNYSEGVREGFNRSWWFNGNPRSETFYVKGKAEGISLRWYRSGSKFKKSNFIAGKPVGMQQAWRKNGKLYSNFEYKNGRIYGLRKANSCVGLEDEVLSVGYYQAQNY